MCSTKPEHHDRYECDRFGHGWKARTELRRVHTGIICRAARLSFEVDTRKFGTEDYNGMTFVVYGELYVIQRYDGDDARSIVASHTDIADLNQIIYVPRITTELNDKKTGTKIADADGVMVC